MNTENEMNGSIDWEAAAGHSESTSPVLPSIDPSMLFLSLSLSVAYKRGEDYNNQTRTFGITTVKDIHPLQ